MKKVLFIPHHPLYGDLKLRLAEMARYMPDGCEAYLLNWTASADGSFSGRVGATLRDLLRPSCLRTVGPWKIVEMPLMHRPLFLAGFFNARMLLPMIKRLNIDCVVNGSYYLFSLGPGKDFKYIVDIADLPALPESGAFGSFIERAVKREVSRADLVTVSSLVLADHLKEYYGAKRVEFLPNGTDLQRFRAVGEEVKNELLERLGIKGRWVIGYIGYLGSWVDVAFMVRVFCEVKKDVPEAVLLFVGSGPDIEKYRRSYSDKDIIFLGSVPPENIEKYFCACDVGVLPNTKSLFQDMAFHIKIIEFAVARRHVISSDLEEVKRMGLSCVTVLPLKEVLWVEALKRAYKVRWDYALDKALDKYDWRAICGRLMQLVENDGI